MTKSADRTRSSRRAKKNSRRRAVTLAISVMALLAGAYLGFTADTEQMPLVVTAHGLGVSEDYGYELGGHASIDMPDGPVPLAASPCSDGYEDRPYTRAEAEAMANMVWGEARGCGKTEQAGCAWCALNRVDAPQWPDDVVSVVTQPWQFCGYDPENPIDADILALVEDVLDRYYAEKSGADHVGRVLPADYYYFTGDGVENYFRAEFEDTGVYWDWSLPSPY